MSIATSLVEQLERIAAEHNASRITRVDVTCGVAQLVVPEALQLAFEAASEGTVAAGATLHLREDPLGARCRGCGHAFAPAIDDYVCPRCDEADVELTAGRDIILQSVECEGDGEVCVSA